MSASTRVLVGVRYACRWCASDSLTAELVLTQDETLELVEFSQRCWNLPCMALGDRHGQMLACMLVAVHLNAGFISDSVLSTLSRFLYTVHTQIY